MTSHKLAQWSNRQPLGRTWSVGQVYLARCLCLKEMESSCPKSRQSLLATQHRDLAHHCCCCHCRMEQWHCCHGAGIGWWNKGRRAAGRGVDLQVHGILNLPG